MGVGCSRVPIIPHTLTSGKEGEKPGTAFRPSGTPENIQTNAGLSRAVQCGSKHVLQTHLSPLALEACACFSTRVSCTSLVWCLYSWAILKCMSETSRKNSWSLTQGKARCQGSQEISGLWLEDNPLKQRQHSPDRIKMTIRYGQVKTSPYSKYPAFFQGIMLTLY